MKVEQTQELFLEKESSGRHNWILFKAFLLAGTFTFAGGIAMLPALKKDLVDKHQVMSKEDFYDYAAMAQAVPGIIGLNFALLIGKKVSGRVGMLMSSIGTILPAFTLMLLATVMAQYIPQAGPVQFALVGVRAASTSAVFMAAYSLGKYLIKNKVHWLMVILAFVMVGILRMSSPIVIVLAGLIGLVFHLRGEEL